MVYITLGLVVIPEELTNYLQWSAVKAKSHEQKVPTTRPKSNCGCISFDFPFILYHFTDDGIILKVSNQQSVQCIIFVFYRLQMKIKIKSWNFQNGLESWYGQ